MANVGIDLRGRGPGATMLHGKDMEGRQGVRRIEAIHALDCLSDKDDVVVCVTPANTGSHIDNLPLTTCSKTQFTSRTDTGDVVRDAAELLPACETG